MKSQYRNQILEAIDAIEIHEDNNDTFRSIETAKTVIDGVIDSIEQDSQALELSASTLAEKLY